jgi:hypothetical protein
MTVPTPDGQYPSPTPWIRTQLVLGWLLVGVPLAYGIYQTLLKTGQLF